MKEKHPFEPIYDQNSKILILGSFPSVKSREANFYYSHPQNRFWRVLSRIYKQDLPVTVGQKRRFLLDNNIAIWDIVKSCKVTGSSDSNITDVEVNDIEEFLKNTNINAICFNGNTSYSYFSKYYKDLMSRGIKIIPLPSTSSANAKFTLDKLCTKWNQILELDNIGNFKASISEKNGIDLVTKNCNDILSVGISTAGCAELEMLKKNPSANIIATTIDKKGLNYTKEIINQNGYKNKIKLKLEDVTKKLPYEDESFDYIYARLILHYLSDNELNIALNELKRILKKDGKFYIVVRSDKEAEANLPDSTFDTETGFTRYPVYIGRRKKPKYIYRRFHTTQSLTDVLTSKEFNIEYIKEYSEQLYSDYERTKKSDYENVIIECLCRK